MLGISFLTLTAMLKIFFHAADVRLTPDSCNGCKKRGLMIMSPLLLKSVIATSHILRLKESLELT